LLMIGLGVLSVDWVSVALTGLVGGGV
jgi:hypothetical protein